MDSEKEAKEAANRRFQREELGALLKLFSSLGLTLTFGIVGSFWLGLYINKTLIRHGIQTRGVPVILFVLAGIALSIYWCYMRIARHLSKFEIPKTADKKISGPDQQDRS